MFDILFKGVLLGLSNLTEAKCGVKKSTPKPTPTQHTTEAELMDQMKQAQEMSVRQEAKIGMISALQEKLHRGILKGVRNISDTL